MYGREEMTRSRLQSLLSRAENGGRKEAGPVKCWRTAKPSACRAAKMAELMSHGLGDIYFSTRCVGVRAGTCVKGK